MNHPPRAGTPRQAMILAAGVGERMRPLTDARAKPSLPLMNRPLILHVLGHLARHGVRKAVVNLHHQAGTLREAIEGNVPADMEVAFSLEPVILGTAGGIRAALPHLDPGSPIFVVNADSFGDVDLASLGAAHEEARSSHGPPATLAVRGRSAGEPYAPIHLDDRGRVAGIAGVGETGEPVTFIGVHVLSPETIDRIPRRGFSDIVRDVYVPMLREGRRLGAFRHAGFWIEIGSPALYLRAHLILLGERGFISTLPSSCGSIMPGPRPSLVGKGSEGIDGSRIEESVLGARCRIGEGAAIARSVLFDHVVIGAGARIEECVVGDSVDVGAGSVLRSSLVLAPGREGSPNRVVPLR